MTGKVVVAASGRPDAEWGNHGTHLSRDAAVMPIIRPAMALRFISV